MSSLPPPPPPAVVVPPPRPPQGFAAPYATSCWPVAPRYAGFWARFAAQFIDGLLVVAVLIVPMVVGIVAFAVSGEGTADESSPGAMLIGATMFLAAGVLAVGALVWLGWREGTRTQTPGKRAMHIKVVDPTTAGPIGGGRGIARRVFAQMVSGQVLYLGFLWMLWDDQKQTWHDKVVNSIVVEA